MIGIVPEFEAEADYYILQNALSWRTDPIAATEIDARLSSFGFDQHAISAEVYVQAREIFVMFEGLLNAGSQITYWRLNIGIGLAQGSREQQPE